MDERQHGGRGRGWILAGMSLMVAYLLSPPFVLSLTYMLGIEWSLIRDTLYFPIVLAGHRIPQVIPWVEWYCSFVVSALRLPVP